MLDVHVSSHPYLADHSIEGTPVVPVVMALEWFTATVARWTGPLNSLTLHGVDVLRKITLPGFHSAGDQFMVRCRIEESQIDLRLLGLGGVPHYRAAVQPSTSYSPDWTLPGDLRPQPIDYAGSVLFHGPAFQALHRIDGITRDGAAGAVVGASKLGWPGRDNWHCDPAALDGGLQLAGLWIAEQIGCRSLPMSVGEFRLHRTGLLTEPIRCVVRHRTTDDTFTFCDIGFLDDSGPRWELINTRFILDPNR
ncbi:hypothetical protein Lesp02_17620 [Lentzea sp. NBRC 105346]|uniref:polyketide synthase dehydratase domain-containing protein n=1 Tax=Lentzea sp. NBRC 105346 TaxID=3032205 RepID=UPI0024A049B1|nr:polyketide synthase dehydratase domain-containing protein [Lentzea sp. NBRC 105346]GLZ29572.1 hypothetical protein Lesp02_17620 [Lentzea sp. NBRC 105346]